MNITAMKEAAVLIDKSLSRLSPAPTSRGNKVKQLARTKNKRHSMTCFYTKTAIIEVFIMNTLPVKLAGILWCFLVYPAFAINKSTVINKTDKPIAVVWTALGCLHFRFDHGEVCGGLILNPGEGHKYQYNWGATNDHIHAGGFVKEYNEYIVPSYGRSPVYQTKFWGNCRLPSPDGKIVYITSMSIDEKKSTIDCVYEIHSPGEIVLFDVSAGDKCSDESYSSDEGYDSN
ncbi:hypothetical protein [Endozoicomonas sp.]|uniref:hypothetical protein n=1 Tax=Endozoicomonas sp. TaxID=1892382 RepID=UPI00383B192C